MKIGVWVVVVGTVVLGVYLYRRTRPSTTTPPPTQSDKYRLLLVGLTTHKRPPILP